MSDSIDLRFYDIADQEICKHFSIDTDDFSVWTSTNEIAEVLTGKFPLMTARNLQMTVARIMEAYEACKHSDPSCKTRKRGYFGVRRKDATGT